MREVENPADLLYLAALGEDVVGFGGFGRDRMFAAIEALRARRPRQHRTSRGPRRARARRSQIIDP